MTVTTETKPATVGDLMARLAAGDTGVSAGDLVAAEDRERLAAADSVRAEALAAAGAEADRQQRIKAAVASLPSPADRAKVETAREAMASAIDAYLAACADHDAAVSAAWTELASGQLGPLPAGVVVNDGGQGRVTVGGTTHRQTDAQHGIRQAATEAIQRHYPRTQVRLGVA